MNKVIHGNSLEILKTLVNESVDCIITSPPYYQLRRYAGIPDYIWDGNENCEHEFELHKTNLMHENRNNITGSQETAIESNSGTVHIRKYNDYKTGFCSKCDAWKGQLGLEPTYQLYLNHLWQIFDECYRVLKDDGTLWVNLGDTYSTQGGQNRGKSYKNYEYSEDVKNVELGTELLKGNQGMPSKCLMMIPHRFAIGMIDRNWILRNDIIWAKRNGMPESVTDRFSKKHEFIFFFVKNQKYYFNLDGVRDTHLFECPKRTKGKKMMDLGYSEKWNIATGGNNPKGKNPGDVSDFWDIPTKPSSVKHYATFNNELITKPIIAGCPEGGIVLDPFAGSGTTLLTALSLNRDAIGIEGSEEYCKIANDRINEHLGLFKEAI